MMSPSPRANQPTVFLVDDDAAALDSLRWLLESGEWHVEAFRSAVQLLETLDPELPGCLLIDIHMPEMGGFELQEALLHRGCHHPLIFVTGYSDVPTCSRAFRNGAADFIEKPIDEEQLVNAVRRAIRSDAARRARPFCSPHVAELVAQLTPREQQVMDLLIEGRSVKEIATDLQIGFPTAARHRSRVLEKMRVTNNVELVRLVLARSIPIGAHY